MKSFFSNIWTKRAFSLLVALFTFIVGYLAYFSVFYSIHIPSRGNVLLITILISLGGLVVMMYTRKQILTRICSFVILPLMLPVVLLYFGEWEIIIPFIVVGVIILLLSGAGEGIKTAVGTLILLLYIFGALGYFLFTSFFVSSAEQTIIDEGFSPSGLYRYRIVNTEDSSNGSTAVYVEPNYADVEFSFATFKLKNMSRIVHLDRPISETNEIEWKTQNRREITEELQKISDNISVSLSDEEMEQYGYSFNDRLQLVSIETKDKYAIGLKASDVNPIPLESLTDNQIAVFNIARDEDGEYYVKEPGEKTREAFPNEDRIYFKNMNDDWLDEFYLQKNSSLPLNSFTDEQLEELGVSDAGDVMYYNGKVCFRFYIAELEDYFDVTSRKLSVELLGA